MTRQLLHAADLWRTSGWVRVQREGRHFGSCDNGCGGRRYGGCGGGRLDCVCRCVHQFFWIAVVVGAGFAFSLPLQEVGSNATGMAREAMIRFTEESNQTDRS
ncbi:MAG: hypothetical protein K0Q46_3903 [Rhodococcus erythropolis]|jgi:hypothetical protein|nr:hypothetical protein [Rhodococcus erythropolis]